MASGPRPWVLAELCYRSAAGLRVDVAVLPVGSTEAHGERLPYSSDARNVAAIAEIACAGAHREGLKPLLLPTLPYGLREPVEAQPTLALTLEPGTLAAVLSEVLDALGRSGVPRVLILNGHTGNEAVCADAVRRRRTAPETALISWWRVAAGLRRRTFEGKGAAEDAMETAIASAHYPRLLECPGDAASRAAGRSFVRRTAGLIRGFLSDWVAGKDRGPFPFGPGE